MLVILAEPFLNIELSRSNEEWVIEDFTYKGWADMHGVVVGDKILALDGTPIKEIERLQTDPYIRGANEITIQNQRKEIIDIAAVHLDLPQQLYMQFILPCINFILIFLIAVYLFNTRRNIIYIDLLIYFMFTMSLAYVSSGASARLDCIGVYLNGSCILLCLVLLIHFLKKYFEFIKVKGLFLKKVQVLYLLPLIAIASRWERFIFPSFAPWDSLVILVIFIALITYLLVVLFHAYITYQVSKLKLLIGSLLFPFFPFIFLYVVSEILFGKPIIEADICAAFLMIIPFNIVFFQLTERLFDITYHISRLRYYFIISFISTTWLTIGMYFLIEITGTKLLGVSLFIFISTMIFLYIKEKADYRGRKILFSPKGNSIHNLYQTIQKISVSYQVKQIFQVLTEDVSKHLEIKRLAVVSYHVETNEIRSTDSSLILGEFTKIESLDIGEFFKNNQFYIALIHQDSSVKNWLVIDHQCTIRLKDEELIWLELLLKYTNTFIESTKIIEQFVDELQLLKRTPHNEPQWLKKLIWFRMDQEKFNIAQELHDTFLQEYIHFARQVDFLSLDNTKYINLHEQMIDSINKLRAYCETLKPPLLLNLGLNVALERLAEKTIERADFQLVTSFDRLYLEDEQLILTIYRIVQEFLNNAIKHSQATIVELSVLEIQDGFEIFYTDNGVGCDLEKIEQSESLGLLGIRERVFVFNGHISLKSVKDNGLEVHIKIFERGNLDDFSANR